MLSYIGPLFNRSALSQYDANNRRDHAGLILLFVAIKIALSLPAMARFGFQRDELLYATLGDHLDWGFKEIPPFIALLAKLSTVFFGTSLFATRVFSTIFSGLLVWLTGRMVAEFGGGRFAIALACLTIILSPAFAASGYLFEPIVFDQVWWVLTAYYLIRYINTSSVKYLYFIGLAVGMGLLTKYSMAFFAIALIFALVLTEQRKLLWNRHIGDAVLVALLLFLPNLMWQFQHNWPFLTQMKELRAQQLVYISPWDFIVQQLIFNGLGLFLWLAGIGYLLFSPGLTQFRFLVFAYSFVFIFMLAMSGKNYYLLGTYPMLFAAGGCAIEKWLQKQALRLKTASLLLLVIPNLFILPLVLPVFPLKQTEQIFNSAYKNLPFFLFEAKWDDHQLHPLTQNYGDMFGWDEMTAKVADAYFNLSPEQQKHTQIYADNYGEAASLHLYGKQYGLPEVVCLNSSFSLWAPSKLNADYIIYVDEKKGENVRKLQQSVESYRKLNEVQNPLAIEKGTGIFLINHPKTAFYKSYQENLAKQSK